MSNQNISELILQQLSSCQFGSDSADINSKLRIINFAINDDKLVEAALDILDRGSNAIRKVRGSSSKRCVWRLIGSTGSTYICCQNFCPCMQFMQQNKLSPFPSLHLCKHLVAIRLAEVLNQCNEQIITDEEFVHVLSNIGSINT